MPDVVKMLISKQSKTIKQVILITKVYLKHAKLLANILNEKYNFLYSEEEIIVTNGASEALDTSLRSIIEPGDDILIPGPIYAGYIPLVETLGGNPVYIDTTQSDFKVTPELIESHLTHKTKAILLNYPTNPTGVILERSEVKI